MKLGIISDIHEDVEQLRKGIDYLRKIKCDHLICLGDMVGVKIPDSLPILPRRNSHEVLKTIQKYCHTVVVGNYDLYAVSRRPKHTADFNYPKNWYKLDYFTRYEYSKGKIQLYENVLPALLSREDRRYIIGLPEYDVKIFNEQNVLLSHYAYPDVTGSTTIRYSDHRLLGPHFRYMRANRSYLSISGHEHCEGIKLFKENGEIIERAYNEKVTLTPNIRTWMFGPSLAAMTDNHSGVLVVDMDNMEAEAIPIEEPQPFNYSIKTEYSYA